MILTKSHIYVIDYLVQCYQSYSKHDGFNCSSRIVFGDTCSQIFRSNLNKGLLYALTKQPYQFAKCHMAAELIQNGLVIELPFVDINYYFTVNGSSCALTSLKNIGKAKACCSMFSGEESKDK